MAVETVTWRGRHFPFNAAQTVNILGEVGPLFAMFVVNGLYGITAGAGALIVCTIAALVACLTVLGRPPIMPFIAGTVSIVFATLTFVTGDAVWVQIKVTLFNALVAVLLLPSRRRLEELRNPALAGSAASATSPSLTDSLSADDRTRAADPR